MIELTILIVTISIFINMKKDIITASKKYANTLYESDIKSLDRDDIAFAFQMGAKYAENSWINAEDSLPCDYDDLIYFGTTVLVFIMLDNLDVMVTHMCKNEATKEWYWKNSGNVTHWMPIPELPK